MNWKYWSKAFRLAYSAWVNVLGHVPPPTTKWNIVYMWSHAVAAQQSRAGTARRIMANRHQLFEPQGQEALCSRIELWMSTWRAPYYICAAAHRASWKRAHYFLLNLNFRCRKSDSYWYDYYYCLPPALFSPLCCICHRSLLLTALIHAPPL